MSAEHLQLASVTSSVDAAWAAFDRAAIVMHDLYAAATPNDPEWMRASRMQKAQEVVTLWDAWRTLFLGDGTGGTA